MPVLRHRDVESFLGRAEPFMLRDEPRHNLEFGLCAQLRLNPRLYGEPAYLATVEQDGEVTGIAMRTPPRNLLVSLTDHSQITSLARDVRDRFDALWGVLSEPEIARGFGSAWTTLSGQRNEDGMRQRIYRLDEVPRVPDVPGRFRAAQEEDRELLVRWLREFTAEAVPDGAPFSVEDAVNHRLRSADAGLVLWVDGEPVCLAGHVGPTPTGIRIGPVYTLPQLRRRGYASACVAALSRMLLEGGRRTCFLFTDRSNPTSNGVYTRIGYRRPRAPGTSP
jgi:predicted GNAT family acetyltransferase